MYVHLTFSITSVHTCMYMYKLIATWTFSSLIPGPRLIRCNRKWRGAGNEARLSPRAVLIMMLPCLPHMQLGSTSSSVLAKELKSGAPPHLSIAFSFDVVETT